MFTPKRLIVPKYSPEVSKDVLALTKAIQDHFLALEKPGALSIVDIGSWTPTDSSGAALTFSASGGVYARIGDLIFAMGYVTYPATADGSTALIGGLPVTVQNTEEARAGGVMTVSTESTAVTIIPNKNATTFSPCTLAGAGITNATLSGDTLYFSITYPASD